MGFVTSDKMLPLVVMRILLEETDAEHPITLELLCERVTDYYEPAACKWENFKRKIARLLDEMMDFFETAEAYNMRSEEHTSELQSLKRISYAVSLIGRAHV